MYTLGRLQWWIASSTVLNDVKLALEKFYDAELLFGDVRRPTIL
jgi:hypothetical protein